MIGNNDNKMNAVILQYFGLSIFCIGNTALHTHRQRYFTVVGLYFSQDMTIYGYNKPKYSKLTKKKQLVKFLYKLLLWLE